MRQRPPPEGFDQEYAEEVTQESFKELKRLVLAAHASGPRFYLIGGWAAWRFHHGLGSRDIDVVFQDRSIMDPFLRAYYESNGYESYGVGLNLGLSQRYRKRVKIGGRDVFVSIDAASMDEICDFHEDRRRRLPYTELTEYCQEWDIGGLTLPIPRPELLLLQKIKAHRDRGWDLDHVAVSPVDAAYLRGKIWKDEHDIRGLVPIVGDWKLLWSISDEHKIRDLAQDTLATLRLRPSK